MNEIKEFGIMFSSALVVVDSRRTLGGKKRGEAKTHETPSNVYRLQHRLSNVEA